MERYLLVKVKAVKVNKSTKNKTTPDFVKCFKEHNKKIQHLLCELYMHNLVLEDDKDSHPAPFIGDIQFQAFLSFVASKLKWAKAYNTFKRRGNGIDLWVRGEPTQPLLLSIRHKQLMRKNGVVGKLGPIHTDIIQARKEYFQDIKEEALAASKQRWEVSSNTMRSQEPFRYRNFQVSSSHFSNIEI